MKTEEEVLNLNDPWQSFWYCFDNQKTANIKAHEKVIIDSKNIHYAYTFAADIENSNKELLFELVLESKDVDYIKAFYNYIDFDKTKYETLMLFI
jgi:hypothetical protein